MKTEVIVVGAGVAGLCCARRLQAEQIACVVLERADAVGGRIRTDRHEGFLLDRGFQVLLTAYPECREVLDYDALKLRCFEPGSIIRQGGRFHRLSDPWRQPLRAVESLLSPVGSLGDKLRTARLRRRLRSQTIDGLFQRRETTTLERLREEGFSKRMIERFFRPFFAGVFLEPGLQTSSRMFEFVFKMFSEGDVVVPAGGMQAIPEMIAGGLEPGTVRFETGVKRIEGRRCHLDSGETFEADHVVVATDGTDAAGLVPGVPQPAWRGTACLYFDAPEPPLGDPVLVLDGDGKGPANNVCVMSQVAPGYAPEGRSLICASVVDSSHAARSDLEGAVADQMRQWFGAGVDDWRLLRRYDIQRALPSSPAPVSRADRSVVVCGDHVVNASIHGAMLSGRQAAETLIAFRR